MERITRFRPAYDKRNPNDPKKDYGIHCMEIWMVVKGQEGAVHFGFMTGMYLASTMDEYLKTGRANATKLSSGNWYYFNKPMGIDVGYHAKVSQYDDQEVRWPTKMKKKNPNLPDPGLNATQKEREKYLSNVKWEKVGKKAPDCEWLGVPCYSDGSAMRAEKFLEVLLSEGDEEIWKMLEEDYRERFGTV